jgi:competence protein ComEA
VAGWVQRAFGHRWLRWLIGGTLLGAVALSAVLLLRGRQHDTLVLEVQPVRDDSAIRVYVGGAVATPGLYTLPRGSRVSEALDAAGGVTAIGDTARLGLAARLEDADQVIVPERRATPSATQTPPPKPPQHATGDSTPAPPTAAAEPTEAGPIDVNTASADELDALPGIGPALAQRIIDYRDANGPFQTIEELADVRGISDTMVEELRPLITLGR